MALSEISEQKAVALKNEVIQLMNSGKSLRQVARIVKRKYNIKLTINGKK